METIRTLKVGFKVSINELNNKELFFTSLHTYDNMYARIFFALRKYLLQRFKNFDSVYWFPTVNPDERFPNGTLKGVFGMMNRSEVDIFASRVVMTEALAQYLDFFYPFGLDSFTFATQKQEYEPEILGILKTFSLSLWVAIISIIIILSLVFYATFQSKYSVNKILLHVFAVFLRQSSIINSSRWGGNLLLYSWVVGAMFICLTYDSVFLSFLAFPPINPIRDLSDLASAITKGQYHCFSYPGSGAFEMFLSSEQENLRILGTDIHNNGLHYDDIFEDFFFERKKFKLAFIIDTEITDLVIAARKFVSDDYFLETMFGLAVRKDFCCKELLDTFVHRLMASGLYFKYENDKSFFVKRGINTYISEKDNSERMLTLTDLAPAFIFLLTGYFISLLVFIWEVVSNRKKKKNVFCKRHTSNL